MVTPNIKKEQILMSELDYEIAGEIINMLYNDIHNHLDITLKDVSEEVDEYIRQKMTEEFRFWKRIETYRRYK